tara:strand:- start:309 stop:443 length:135 start_codon:yes stop_codon:yes gene_type:complete
LKRTWLSFLSESIGGENRITEMLYLFVLTRVRTENRYSLFLDAP